MKRDVQYRSIKIQSNIVIMNMRFIWKYLVIPNNCHSIRSLYANVSEKHFKFTLLYNIVRYIEVNLYKSLTCSSCSIAVCLAPVCAKMSAIYSTDHSGSTALNTSMQRQPSLLHKSQLSKLMIVVFSPNILSLFHNLNTLSQITSQLTGTVAS